MATTKSRQARVKWFHRDDTTSLPSRSQSKPSKGRGSCSFQAFQVRNQVLPSQVVFGCIASQPPMDTRCVVARPSASSAAATAATHV